MSFPRYPKYKDSGVEWLGQIPAQWDLTRIRHLGRLYGGLTGKSAAEFTAEGPLTRSYIPFTNILNNTVIDPNQLDNVQVAETEEQNIVEDGDLLFLMSSEDHEFLGYSSVARRVPPGTMLNSFCKGLRPTRCDACPEYVNYFCRSPTGRALISQLGFGFTRINLRASALASVAVPLPSLLEQTAIAAFLDRETAKIDPLIAEQQRLIELLQEKRQVVISHAVTKGLNPNAPMKPSGVQWLGDVPDHWSSGRLSFFTELLVDGTHRSPESFPSGDWMYVTAKNIKESGLDLDDISYVSERDHREIYKRCPVRQMDVLYIKDGATAGVAVVNTMQCEFSLLSSVALIRPMATVLRPRFVAYLLNAGQFKNDALNQLVGGAMTRFTLEMIARFKIALPPPTEQDAVVSFLDREIAHIDELIEVAIRAITLLQERRSALISAAVTGQIDVRGLSQQEAA